MKRLLSILPAVLLPAAGCAPVLTAGNAAAADHAPAVFTFESFDGGGPEYRIEVDAGIVSHSCTRRYAKANHAELEGAGYRLICTFRGLKAGEAAMTVRERSPIAGNADHRYIVKVDEKLNVTITPAGDAGCPDAAAEPER